jgi:hypothetical protein
VSHKKLYIDFNALVRDNFARVMAVTRKRNKSAKERIEYIHHEKER